jgi:hypothetical protein
VPTAGILGQPVAPGALQDASQVVPAAARFQALVWTGMAVLAMLTVHYALAAQSLLQENPTVDEVVHLPAGITYWQTGTFRLYHHNPPLFKLVAALPVVVADPVTEPLYALRSWRSRDPSHTTFSQSFARFNIPRYFELFHRARLVMPVFSIVGGLVVYFWSRSLYGAWGGLLSLALWALSPNILANARLVTSDVCATALGALATFVFWCYQRRPGWPWAIAAGVALGLAQLSKFSMLLLYLVWPAIYLVRLALVGPQESAPDRQTPGAPDRRRKRASFIRRSAIHALAIAALSILTIDAGYFFERVGLPLGEFEFGSRLLTRAVSSDVSRPRSQNLLYEAAWQFRINRFRDSWLGWLPAPLPEHYLLGFDEQKIETEGIPHRFIEAVQIGDLAARQQQIARERTRPESRSDARDAYSVYLDGDLRQTGWSDYYLRCLLYKVPEGTWSLFCLSIVVLLRTGRSKRAWFDELAVLSVPVAVLSSMSFLTDINLGLRYVLPILPYAFISVGKVVPWCQALSRPWRYVAGLLISGSLAITAGSTALIHPHYLAYLNWACGGPDRVPARLIDSNLDWGQDLVGLADWARTNIPDERLGLAYFGQINPSIFAMRGQPLRWFLPPVPAGAAVPLARSPSPWLIGPAPTLSPGYYAVSVTLLYGLPWRLYDPAPPDTVPEAWEPAWNVYRPGAFGYFRRFTPIARIGHSIYVYYLRQSDIDRAAREAAPARDGAPGA